MAVLVVAVRAAGAREVAQVAPAREARMEARRVREAPRQAIQEPIPRPPHQVIITMAMATAVITEITTTAIVGIIPAQ